MTAPHHLRLASPDDLDAIAPLMAEFNRHEHIPWRPDTMLPALRRVLDDPALGLMLLAVEPDSGRLLGYALATLGYDVEFSGHDAFITELFIDAPARGQGLGRALLLAITQALQARDVRAVHLMVRPENHSARALYEDLGFEVIPRLLMTRRL